MWVAPLDRIDEAEVVTDDRDRGIRAFFWAHDGRHLLYVQDQGGDENWRFYAVDLRAAGTRDLTPFDGVQVQSSKWTSASPMSCSSASTRTTPSSTMSTGWTWAPGS